MRGGSGKAGRGEAWRDVPREPTLSGGFDRGELARGSRASSGTTAAPPDLMDDAVWTMASESRGVDMPREWELCAGLASRAPPWLWDKSAADDAPGRSIDATAASPVADDDVLDRWRKFAAGVGAPARGLARELRGELS